MSNQFAVPNGADNIIYTSREAAQRDIARAIATPIIAGAPIGTPVVECGPSRAQDGDAVFKAALAKAHGDPHGLAKSETVATEPKSEPTVRKETERVTGSVSVIDLLKAAHETKLDIFDLTRGYAGRAIVKAEIAKTAKRIDASDIERSSPALRAALEDFDVMARRLNAMTERHNGRPAATRF